MGHTKEIYPVIKEQRGNLRCCQLSFLCPAGYQPKQLTKLVHYKKQGIIPIHLQKISHKIQREILKFTGRHWQWLQQASRLHIHVLGTLANCTPSNKALYIQSQIGPPNPSQKCLYSFTYTKMSCVARIMKFLHQHLMQTPRPRNH